MKKQDIKNIVHQMIKTSMQSFDCSFDESNMSEEDKAYAYKLFGKYYEEFEAKIKDDSIKSMYDVSQMVEYVAAKDDSELRGQSSES